MFEKTDKNFYAFKKHLNPSKDTIYKLKKFIHILDDYQDNMNLIGKSTRASIWERHILDSAQIEKYLHKENSKYSTIDVGTGAGFPGIVLATLGRKDLLLCEKSKKKRLFLNVIAKECNLNIKIFEDKVENLEIYNAKTIISRAFAPLKDLLVKVKHFIYSDTSLIIHKGKTYMQEIKEAKKFFSFNYKCYDSLTNPYAKILQIQSVRKKSE
ncbi:MAG: 16S rRNA (guanine(527)-N(7))-methyltransferase RsmG [Alphaproteobacteria bacterium TMED62]|nr:MAG: 16S rRNA (guanine(527)-N(7))-methyltransferase RsmG [Alphaproteobacteria bacterium TMED62]